MALTPGPAWPEFSCSPGTSEAAATRDAPLLSVAAKPLKDGWLIVVTNAAPRLAIETCRERWAIECLFGDAKTRGLNLEDTRITDPRKPGLLMSLVALALGRAGRAAADLPGNRVPPRKRHGCYARPWFRTGFDHIRNRLRSDPIGAIASWHRITPKPAKSHGVV